MAERDDFSDAVRSDLAGDPEMTELIQYFVSEMPERVRLIAECWRDRRLSDLRQVAHQLKGASAGYGFPVIGTAAKQLEDALLAEHAVEAVQREVDALIEMCRRVTL